ncbi:lysophospholipid acyltransferase family protein [Roseomonas sp. 18066]|uniref:lysophospholipid acyltransferase family protein n=1 Tax=Roseomonas sp. 18066 TaxID=2681412 RepID=UPI001F35D8E5|nr:lysophospholipid acyltransferase family protein [Roseomonas sp. 18066]
MHSPRLLRLAGAVFTATARRRMRAPRLACWGAPAVTEGPIVVFASHASWWDGIFFMALAQRLFPARRGFVPMQAAALGHYSLFRRLGAFPVDPRDGAEPFLATAARVLARDMLWMNAPGRFADARRRPQPIAAGLVRLAERVPQAQFIPLAMEYPFWSARRPEMLAAFGPPLPGAALQAMPRPARRAALAGALGATLDRLAGDAMARDPARFLPVEQERDGMGGFFDRRRKAASARGLDPELGR